MKSYLQPTRMIAEARESKKGHKLFIEILIFLLVFFIAQSLVSIPVTIATVISIFTSEDVLDTLVSSLETGNTDAYMNAVQDMTTQMPDWVMLVQLFSTALMTATAIFHCTVIEKRSIASMGLRKKHFWREYAIGSLLGILLISLCVGICWISGAMTLQVSSFSPIMWILFLIGFLIQGMSEEVLCRGYMMVSVSRKNALWLAVLTNSVIFSLLHIANPGFGILPFINIILFGVLESIYVLKRGDLWGACAIHSLWNFFQGNVFGVSVSGLGLATSPLSATVADGMDWLTGGAFGVEAGIATTVVIGIAILLVFFLLPTNKEEIAPAEESNETA